MMSSAPLGDLVIKRGGAGDVAAIMPIMRAAFADDYGEAWSHSQCTTILGLPGASLLLASCGAGLVGFALARTVLDECELMLLAVDTAIQRNRVGGALLARVVDDARKANVKSVFVEVRCNNPALGFYQGHQFAPVGRRANYYRGKQGQLTDAITLLATIV